MVVYAADHMTDRPQARQLLAQAIREQYELFPLPAIETGRRGKPFFPDYPGIHFNLSHSAALVLCALDSAPVGADVQIVAPRRPITVERCCSPDERAWLRGRGDNWDDFALLWSLKEALVKQRGTGLTFPVSAIAPPLPAGPESLLAQDGLWFRLYQGEGWRGAACGLTPPPEQLLWRTLPEEKNL